MFDNDSGWQEHCTRTFHYYPPGTNISWCGGVLKNSSCCNTDTTLYPGYPMNRACPHCLGSKETKPAKWQRRIKLTRNKTGTKKQ